MIGKSVVAALSGAAIFLALGAGTASAQAPNDDQVRLCIKHVAEMERSVARTTKGAERKQILGMLGQAKRSCIEGHIGIAYSNASKGLQLAKRSAK